MPALPGKRHGPGVAVMEDDPMASLEKYRACIQHVLTERALKGGDQWVEAQMIWRRIIYYCLFWSARVGSAEQSGLFNDTEK
jgi:hypothetical protein